MLTSSNPLTYKQRATLAQHPTAQKLFSLIDQKKSNLAIAADVTTSNALLKLTEQIAPHICILKTHIDIIQDFTPQLTSQLRALANQHQFLIFEDRKFADIGNTVKEQFHGGIYKISSWADIINAHSLPGPGIIEALQDDNTALLLLAEMSSKGFLGDESYKQRTLEMAHQYPNHVIGFITQHRLTNDPKLLHLTPGVQLARAEDPLGQQYRTPKIALQDQQNDLIIVGRGVTHAENPQAAAALYQKVAWEAVTT